MGDPMVEAVSKEKNVEVSNSQEERDKIQNPLRGPEERKTNLEPVDIENLQAIINSYSSLYMNSDTSNVTLNPNKMTLLPELKVDDESGYEFSALYREMGKISKRMKNEVSDSIKEWLDEEKTKNASMDMDSAHG